MPDHTRRARQPSPARRVGRAVRARRPGAVPAAPPAPPARVDPAAARSRLLAALRRPGRGQLVAALILFVVGLGGATQVRINTADDAYSTARREDLVQLLDGLGAESRRLETEIAELERTRVTLRSGADTQRVARQQAERRLSDLAILAGTAPAAGSGIRMRISDPGQKVTGETLLNAVEELRDAGAEVIEINDRVRVVASTWFGTDGSRLLVDGQPVSRPIVVEAIGDPTSLEEGVRFRGGLVSEITGPRIGGQVQVDKPARVVVESLHTVRANQYAQPAPAPPTPR